MNTHVISIWVHERYAEAGRLPASVHVGRVAGLGRSAADKAVAWLHDIVEDDIATLDDVREVLMKTSEFSTREIEAIVGSVDVLKRRTNEGETYPSYIERLDKSGDARMIRIEQLDLLDHLDPYDRHAPRPDQAQRYIAALDRIVRTTVSNNS